MRLQNIILTELVYERLVAYEELERVMNKRMPINESKQKVRYYLKKITKLNSMIAEWESINSVNESQNINNKKDNDNG